MEEQCKLVSSRGILKSCSLRPLNPISSTNRVSLTAGSLNPGGSVYVCNDALEDFFENYFHRIEIPFVLVSGDSDREIDQDLLSTEPLTEALASNRLLAWFSQNLTANHPKLHHLPIGMDYHTASIPGNPFEPNPLSPIEQERVIIDIIANAPPFNERSSLVYADFKPESSKPDRALALTAFANQSVSPIQRVTRSTSWALCSKFKFILSPMGRGIDCHRTWEALALGCIPILRRTAIDRLYENLPILFIPKWSCQSLNIESYIERVEKRLLPQTRRQPKELFLAHWVGLISLFRRF